MLVSIPGRTCGGNHCVIAYLSSKSFNSPQGNISEQVVQKCYAITKLFYFDKHDLYKIIFFHLELGIKVLWFVRSSVDHESRYDSQGAVPTALGVRDNAMQYQVQLQTKKEKKNILMLDHNRAIFSESCVTRKPRAGLININVADFWAAKTNRIAHEVWWLSCT